MSRGRSPGTSLPLPVRAMKDWPWTPLQWLLKNYSRVLFSRIRFPTGSCRTHRSLRQNPSVRYPVRVERLLIVCSLQLHYFLVSLYPTFAVIPKRIKKNAHQPVIIVIFLIYFNRFRRNYFKKVIFLKESLTFVIVSSSGIRENSASLRWGFNLTLKDLPVFFLNLRRSWFHRIPALNTDRP